MSQLQIAVLMTAAEKELETAKAIFNKVQASTEED